MSCFQHILLEKKEGVLRITLNRPEKLNAINLAMVQDLHHLMDEAERRYADHVLVFEGAGDKAFVAGADIAELEARGRAEALEGINARLFDRIAKIPLPTIAKSKAV
jgi:enoyl-CoA hydratase/carnithine racemase